MTQYFLYCFIVIVSTMVVIIPCYNPNLPLWDNKMNNGKIVHGTKLNIVFTNYEVNLRQILNYRCHVWNVINCTLTSIRVV